MYRVGIVGAGSIGRWRAEVAQKHLDTEVALVCDARQESAAALAAECDADIAATWEELVAADLDIAVVANYPRRIG